MPSLFTRQHRDHLEVVVFGLVHELCGLREPAFHFDVDIDVVPGEDIRVRRGDLNDASSRERRGVADREEPQEGVLEVVRDQEEIDRHQRDRAGTGTDQDPHPPFGHR